MAQKIFSAFPNYGKEKAEYLLTLTEFLTMWPKAIVEPVCNPLTGIASQLDFPPCIAEMRRALEAEAAKQKQDRLRLLYQIKDLVDPPSTIDKSQQWRWR